MAPLTIFWATRKPTTLVAEFIRSKIRETVKDPETSQKLLPLDHPYGSKRALMDTNYFETYNRENVNLVDLRQTPIQEITAKGIRTSEEDFEFDVIVFATGFDAMTGTFMKIDIRGRDGMTLKEKWAEGPKTYLGLQVSGFPNMFMITGPGSPSVLCNMPVCIEQHIEWVGDFIGWMREHNLETAEADPRAEEEWGPTSTRSPTTPSLYMPTPGTWERTSPANLGSSCLTPVGRGPTVSGAMKLPRTGMRDSCWGRVAINFLTEKKVVITRRFWLPSSS